MSNSVARIELEPCTLTLHSYISVTDKVKMNEQNKSIATGPSTYACTELEPLLHEDMAILGIGHCNVRMVQNRIIYGTVSRKITLLDSFSSFHFP